MIDIHSHVLPGLDDGAPTEGVSLAMLVMAAEHGTTHIVGSPHCNATYEYSLEKNQLLAKSLQEKMGGRIQVLTGCDFHLSYENLELIQEDAARYTINQGICLLIEFGNYSIPPHTEDVFFQLRQLDVVPIITHPERNAILMEEKFDLIRQLVEMGCAVQITAGSLTGRFGERARRACRRLLNWKMVHIVASDAHNTEGRSPRLRNARHLLAKSHGKELAQVLFVDNPRAVIESQPLPYFPIPEEPPRKKIFGIF